MTEYRIKCARCGKRVTMNSARALYCPECQVVANRERTRERYWRRRGVTRDGRHCANCGAEVADGRKRRCDACAAVVVPVAEKPKPPRVFVCAGCGQTYEMSYRVGGAPKWCDKCLGAAGGDLKRVQRQRAYQQAYYRRNYEKAKQYQQTYRKAHRRKQYVSAEEYRRPPDLFHCGDLTRMPAEKLARAVDAITRGRAIYTMGVDR